LAYQNVFEEMPLSKNMETNKLRVIFKDHWKNFHRLRNGNRRRVMAVNLFEMRLLPAVNFPELCTPGSNPAYARAVSGFRIASHFRFPPPMLRLTCLPPGFVFSGSTSESVDAVRCAQLDLLCDGNVYLLYLCPYPCLSVRSACCLRTVSTVMVSPLNLQ